ncbi:DUF3857 domain-containing protein [Flammeovirga sp. EKP202]|uniref:DUF3857 domain-containing protein n=1 Tax=Flammeovirga sp. EKP202 TaxID=2770592 RepID=UPI00165EDF53|nr:DUF3857 domain-containing protein [Flammeovirga sp. EKP202]MBD0400239.1 DUF3857 domain-containing protein [Flammeovirga sp. EKP202]
MRFLIYVFLFSFSISVVFGQEEDIDEKLLKGADFVMLESEEELIVESEEEITFHCRQKLLVLNSDGKEKVQLTIYYDNSAEITQLEGSIKEPGYKKPKKFKDSDVLDYATSPYAGYVTDNRVKVISPVITRYPAVIEYEYTKSYDGGFVYPKWYPVQYYREAILSSEFTVRAPKGMKLRIRELNTTPYTKKVVGDKEVYQWSLKDYYPKKKEYKSLPFTSIFPNVSVQPYSFTYEGTKGNLETWSNFGDYIVGLNKGTRDLSPEVIAEVQEMTKDAANDLEKAQIIYEYMQGKTRYVSIQLGIGGLKPFNASEVHEKGYGDCKGLSNYTYNLMKAVGIDARYIIIKGGRKYTTVDEEMVGSQFNHAILCLPDIVDQDTVWLECTSQMSPFGYIGRFTGNRKALIIEEGNSKLVHTKQYTAEDNLQERKTVVKLKQDKSVWIQTHLTAKGFQYGEYNRLERESEEDLKKEFLKKYALSASELESIEVHNDKNYPDPTFTMDYTINVRNYSKIVNGGMSFNLFPYKGSYSQPKRYRSRKTDFVIDYPYTDVDTVDIYLLEGMIQKALPTAQSLASEFGNYSTSVVKNGENCIRLIRTLTIKRGVYAKEKYGDYYSFMKEVRSYDSRAPWMKYSPDYKDDEDDL